MSRLCPWSHTLAPTGRRSRLTKVRFVTNYSCPPNVFGSARRWDDETIRVDLSDDVVAGLTRNDREAWLTFFHECAHVVFGDCDTDTRSERANHAHEVRAEAFAVFMIDAINDVVRASVAHHASGPIDREAGRAQTAALCARFGSVPRGAAFKEMSPEDGDAFMAIVDAKPAYKSALWAELWRRTERTAGAGEAFTSYEMSDGCAPEAGKAFTVYGGGEGLPAIGM